MTKKSNLTFAEGFFSTLGDEAESKGAAMMVFDWDKAAKIINELVKQQPTLVASAGLDGDWNYTGGEIFKDGNPVYDEYTYLSSNWASPTLNIDIDGEETELECYCDIVGSRFDSDSKWDEKSLSILNS